MIDAKLFDELKKRGFITNPNINAEDYESIDDLKNRGYITHVTDEDLAALYGDGETPVPTPDEDDIIPTDTVEDDNVTVKDDDVTVDEGNDVIVDEGEEDE